VADIARSVVMEFSEAFARLQSDPKLAEKFIDDPEGVLSIMGVDTTDLVIQAVPSGPNAFRNVKELQRRGPIDEPLGLTVCGSIGYIVCGSVGGDLLTAEQPLRAETAESKKTRQK
jgi:hypothetical protein